MRSRNLGQRDRIVRCVVGVLIAAQPFLWDVASPLMTWATTALGGSFILTAVLGICPIYWLFGLSTCGH